MKETLEFKDAQIEALQLELQKHKDFINQMLKELEENNKIIRETLNKK